ncbi:MAG: hypothetical protein E7260_01055 [Lachnospiraceae bacterium]|nr:hypothetical protein [Lachnospiraceae bacterium]
MEGRNIPLIIMLSAGSVVSIACIVYDFSLKNTLLIVLCTLVGFYLIGQIVKRLILSINKNAEERAALLETTNDTNTEEGTEEPEPEFEHKLQDEETVEE